MCLRKPFWLTMLALFVSPMAGAQILFSTDFESSARNFGFGGTYEGRCVSYPDWNSCSGNWWGLQHLPTGGWNGTAGVRLAVRRGYSQDSIGWYQSSHFKEWRQGDHFYVRFRVKFDPTMRWDGTGSQQNKMFMWGAGEYRGSNQRIMLHQEKDHVTSPCADMPSQYTNANYGTFAVKRNIQEYCTPPVPITYDVWYHVQFYAKSGTTPDSTNAEFKLWVNNNNFATPTSQKIGGFNLAVENHWNQEMQFGGFWTDPNNNRDVSWIVDDLQVSETFDPNWFGASVAPRPPQGLSAQ